MIKPINHNRKKSGYIFQAIGVIIKDYNGLVPRTLDGLKSLKGVGDKIANIVLQQVFGIKIGIAVDLHVARISQRLGLADQTNNIGRLTK